VLSFLAQGKLIVAVDENETAMRVDADEMKAICRNGNIIRVRSYAEAAGILVAHKEGIYFESITKNVSKLKVINL
jgi:hypothetical protein